MITKDYFLNNPLFIPQGRPNNGVSADIYSTDIKELERAISLYEREYMIYLLGSELYSEYLSDMADTEKALKWADFNTKLNDSTLKVSPIANYIYCKYVEDNSMQYNGRVFTTEKKENQDVIGMEKKLIKEWNRCVEMTSNFIDWLVLNPVETTAEIDTSYWDTLTDYKNYFGVWC